MRENICSVGEAISLVWMLERPESLASAAGGTGWSKTATVETRGNPATGAAIGLNQLLGRHMCA